MTSYIIFPICSLLFVVITAIVFFVKKRVSMFETKMYSVILITTIAGLLLEISSAVISSLIDNMIVKEIMLRLLVIYFAIWTAEFYLYVRNIGGYVHKISNKLYVILSGLFCIVPLVLPLYEHIENGVIMYTYGPSVTSVYVFSILLVNFCLFRFATDGRKNKSKKYIPLFAFMALSLVAVIVQSLNPQFILITTIESLVTVLMFHTIENPDIRLIEYEKREKELAVSASEAKSAFLSSMSHELRTPLNAIVGLSEDIMSYQEQLPPVVREDSNDIVNASNTLLELIGNILDISKIEGGKLELVEADYLPKEEIESLLKIMRTKVEEKDLLLNVYIDPNIPECLYGDRLRIKQIINNFLSNAIKYTEKGHINFGVRWINNSLEIKVADTGRGIKPEDMNKVFEKFERLHVEKASSVQGTGLGLSITKSLVELMGGSINVDSVYGQGSTFSVVIPQKIGDKTKVVREALTVEEKHTTDYTGKKLLVVDDNKLNIKVLRKAIASFNFEVDECYDGQAAIDKINAGHYDIILMDIMMPVMGGEEAMGILKQNPAFNTPVIALTADATTGAKERYMACGFVDYLAKPFSRDIIATKLENVLGNTK